MNKPRPQPQTVNPDDMFGSWIYWRCRSCAKPWFDPKYVFCPECKGVLELEYA